MKKIDIGLPLNTIQLVDALEGMKKLKTGSIDLIVTSPPYADEKKYGSNKEDKIGFIPPDLYMDWIIPFAHEMYRVLSDEGVLVFNINSVVRNNKEHTFVYRIPVDFEDKVGFSLHQTHIWTKSATTNMGSKKRTRDMKEYIFCFRKGNEHTFNRDDVRGEYSEASLKRMKYKYGANKYNPNGKEKFIKANEKGALPTNIHKFKSARKKNNVHIAPFDQELSDYFIKLYSNENDVVLDTFMGSGTVGVSALGLNRNFIGFEVVEEYKEYALKRISDVKKVN